MSATDETVVEPSKIKIVLVIVSAAIFVAIGSWLATLDEAGLQRLVKDLPFGYNYFPFNNPTAAHYLGIAAVVFFAACCLFGIYKFFDKTPGLILNATGFVDNASAVAAGFVPWSDVKDLQTWQLNVTHRLDDLPNLQIEQREVAAAPALPAKGRRTSPFLIVIVRDPERYVRRGNPLKRLLNAVNANRCGSPITIPSVALKIDFAELLALFKSYWSRYATDSPGTPHESPGA